MESNRKRRGFLKGKLVMPFYRTAANPSSSSSSSSSSMVKLPNEVSYSNCSTTGFLIQQDYVFAPPKTKVTFMVPESGRESVARYEEVYGMEGDDETVDARAATYISYVQERFKLDRINSERMKLKHLDRIQM